MVNQNIYFRNVTINAFWSTIILKFVKCGNNQYLFTELSREYFDVTIELCFCSIFCLFVLPDSLSLGVRAHYAYLLLQNYVNAIQAKTVFVLILLPEQSTVASDLSARRSFVRPNFISSNKRIEFNQIHAIRYLRFRCAKHSQRSADNSMFNFHASFFLATFWLEIKYLVYHGFQYGKR